MEGFFSNFVQGQVYIILKTYNEIFISFFFHLFICLFIPPFFPLNPKHSLKQFVPSEGGSQQETIADTDSKNNVIHTIPFPSFQVSYGNFRQSGTLICLILNRNYRDKSTLLQNYP